MYCADFEKATYSAAELVWPNGCGFHLGQQSWWRAIQDAGLSSVYKNEDNWENFVLKRLFWLPFLNEKTLKTD